MKRTKGYSLAEVILTLAIVGALAALTIPVMINNSSNDQFVAGLKKDYALLSDVADQLLEEAGGDFTGYFANNNNIKNIFKTRLQVTKDCPDDQVQGNCWHNGNTMWKNLSNKNAWGNTTSYAGLILRNGSLVIFDIQDSLCGEPDFKVNNTNVQCGIIFTDVNGLKGPNIAGRDIFEFKITRTGIFPSGSEGELAYDSNSTADPWNWSCKTNGSNDANGKGCAARVLIEGKMNY